MRKERKIVTNLLASLCQVGALMSQIGEVKQCEECYLNYIAIVEVVFGNNTL